MVRFVKARRREEASIGLAAILFWVGYSFINWFPVELQEFIKSSRGHLFIPAVLYVTGFGFLSYGRYRIWRLVQGSDLPPVTDKPLRLKARSPSRPRMENCFES